jgi:hypothetical protein
MKLHYHFSKSIRVNKRYMGLTIEAEGNGYAEFNITTELGYNTVNISQPSSQTEVLAFDPVFWDDATWDLATWDGVGLGPANIKLEGTAENISIVIRKNSDFFEPISLTGAIIRYIPRRQLR